MVINPVYLSLKVKVVLRIVNKRHTSTSDSCLTVDSRKKQVLLRETNTTTVDDVTKRFEKAPRLYSFDNIFTQESSQQELCSGTLVDLLHTVVNGNDACLLTYGYPKLGMLKNIPLLLFLYFPNASEKLGIFRFLGLFFECSCFLFKYCLSR